MANLVENKKIGLDYEILEKYEAGIELFGFEVKSVRAKQGNLQGAYVTVRGHEAFLVKSLIPAYQPANTPKDYDPERNRKLLLTQTEILILLGIEKQKGLTIVPVSMYNKGRFIKVALAIVRGKKKYDKRETLRKKETKRHIERTMKYE